jgi:hypothetical protein
MCSTVTTSARGRTREMTYWCASRAIARCTMLR